VFFCGGQCFYDFDLERNTLGRQIINWDILTTPADTPDLGNFKGVLAFEPFEDYLSDYLTNMVTMVCQI
jgi:hypothetical protein